MGLLSGKFLNGNVGKASNEAIPEKGAQEQRVGGDVSLGSSLWILHQRFWLLNSASRILGDLFVPSFAQGLYGFLEGLVFD